MSDRQLTILLIDDDDVDRESVLRLLNDGFEVRGVRTAREGLEHANRQPPDCVLLDYRLPDSDGLTLLEAFVTRQMPVIMLTGRGSEHVAVEAMKRGARDYLVKGATTAGAMQRSIRNAVAHNLLERKLHEKQQELERFVHTAAHDLKAPLYAVAGYAKMLERRCGERLAGPERECLERLASRSDAMLGFIDELLEYVRIGHSDRPLLPVACQEVWDEACANLAAAIDEAHAEIDCGELPRLWADRTALMQVFQNLLGNALRYRGERPAYVRVRAAQVRDLWHFSVEDSGLGIPPRAQERIFSPLERVRDGKRPSGTGLGLSICRKIIAQHGGRIWVESSPGQGTVFHFTLPVELRGHSGPTATQPAVRSLPAKSQPALPLPATPPHRGASQADASPLTR